jgi:hypothetical protein
VHFTKDQFMNKCFMISNYSKNAFQRFLKEGYISEFYTKTGSENGQKQSTGLFKLTHRFIIILTAIYEKIGYEKEFDFKPSYTKSLPPKVEEMILKMAQENQEIVTGKKEPDKIIIQKP